MTAISATDVRKDWSRTIDSVIRNKPALIKRTHDYMLLLDIEIMKLVLSAYIFNVSVFNEDDGSITLSSDELDIAVNGKTLGIAKLNLAEDILEYAADYYENFEVWSKAPNRQAHIPYILKLLLISSPDELAGELVCHDGKN